MKRKMFSENTHYSHQSRSPEKIIYTYGVDILSGDDMRLESVDECTMTMSMEDSVAAVEEILKYNFKDKKLLEEALTHSSYTDSVSYQRLEFVGDAALELAIRNFFYLTYPDVDPGQLSLLRAANVSTEKLARVAVHRGLYKYVRHRATLLSDKVREFVTTVEEEDEIVVHGGQMKAPKVLADIVESVAAAVYVDCGFNLQYMWVIIGKILEPLVMLNVLEKQPQPITMLFETCQKDGKNVDFKYRRTGDRNIASVYVDGHFIASGSSETKDNAKLHAAEAALSKLTMIKQSDSTTPQTFGGFNEATEIGFKQKRHELCKKKRWLKPTYKYEQFITSASSEFKDNANFHAAEAALSKLTMIKHNDSTTPQTFGDFNEGIEIGAKQKLHELCKKKRWLKPTYNLEQELGPAHDKRYISSVKVEPSESILFVIGDERSRVKDAENSAASRMFRALRESGYMSA